MNVQLKKGVIPLIKPPLLKRKMGLSFNENDDVKRRDYITFFNIDNSSDPTIIDSDDEPRSKLIDSDDGPRFKPTIDSDDEPRFKPTIDSDDEPRFKLPPSSPTLLSEYDITNDHVDSLPDSPQGRDPDDYDGGMNGTGMNGSGENVCGMNGCGMNGSGEDYDGGMNGKGVGSEVYGSQNGNGDYGRLEVGNGDYRGGNKVHRGGNGDYGSQSGNGEYGSQKGNEDYRGGNEVYLGLGVNNGSGREFDSWRGSRETKKIFNTQRSNFEEDLDLNSSHVTNFDLNTNFDSSPVKTDSNTFPVKIDINTSPDIKTSPVKTDINTSPVKTDINTSPTKSPIRRVLHHSSEPQFSSEADFGIDQFNRFRSFNSHPSLDVDLNNMNSISYNQARQLIHQAFENVETTLHLANMALYNIPDEIKDMNNLVIFDDKPSSMVLYQLFLHNNKLSQLPPSLFKFTKLNVLSVRQNKLTNIPPNINKLINLTDLNIGSNRIEFLPWQFLELENLQTFNSGPNPFSPPSNAVKVLKKANSLKSLNCVSKINHFNNQTLPSLKNLCLNTIAKYDVSYQDTKNWKKFTPKIYHQLIASAVKKGKFDDTCSECDIIVVNPAAEVIEWWDILINRQLPIRRQFCCGHCASIYKKRLLLEYNELLENDI